MQSREKCFWLNASTLTVFTGYQPCAEILHRWAQGITAFEIVSEPTFEDQPPFTPQEDVKFYPTGRWVVIARDSELFEITPNSEEVLEAGRMYVSPDIFNMIVELGQE